MLEFPYLQLPGGVTRPIIPVVLEGPSGRRLLDGLLDSGSNRTLIPRREAQAVGLQLPPNPDGHMQTAGGIAIAYRVADGVLELRVSRMVVRWQTSIAFADDPLQIIHLGNRGFLEYFHGSFQGPEKRVVLVPQPSLPRA